MLQLGSFEGWRLGLVAVSVVAVLGTYLIAPAAGAVPHLLLAVAFGIAVSNIAISEQSTGAITAADLALLFVTGFAASAYAAPSVPEEFLYALSRMALLGLSVAALAWFYQQWRGTMAISPGDILLIAVLGAFLPFAVAVYAVAFAVTLTIAAIAALHLVRGEQTSLNRQLPIASTLSVLYFGIWIAYRLKTDVIML